MKVQDLIFDISNEEPVRYSYWTVNENGEILYLTTRDDYLSATFEDVDGCTIDAVISGLWGFPTLFDGEYIDYAELMKYKTDIDIEPSGNIVSCGISKYQVLCVRGSCSCTNCKVDKEEVFTHIRSVPCYRNRPDYNAYTHKWPNFLDLFEGVLSWVNVCPCTDSIVAWFGCEPDYYNQDITDAIICVFQIKDNSIRVISEKSKAIKLYKEYNKKYPTEDRQIEKNFCNDKYGWYFRF